MLSTSSQALTKSNCSTLNTGVFGQSTPSLRHNLGLREERQPCNVLQSLGVHSQKIQAPGFIKVGSPEDCQMVAENFLFIYLWSGP